jgi:hypothetical protein
VNSFYAIGLNFDSLARDSSGSLLDSIALFNSAKDSVSAYGMSWEKWNGNYKRIRLMHTVITPVYLMMK